MAQGLPALVGSALIALLSAAVLFSCQKGPAPQTGEKIDNLVSALSTLAVPTTGPSGPIAVVKSSRLARALDRPVTAGWPRPW